MVGIIIAFILLSSCFYDVCMVHDELFTISEVFEH